MFNSLFLSIADQSESDFGGGIFANTALKYSQIRQDLFRFCLVLAKMPYADKIL